MYYGLSFDSMASGPVARTLFEDLQSQREVAIIPQRVETFVDFIGTLGAYKDFFALDETTQFYYLAEEVSRVSHGTSGIPGIYSNGRTSGRVG